MLNVIGLKSIIKPVEYAKDDQVRPRNPRGCVLSKTSLALLPKPRKSAIHQHVLLIADTRNATMRRCIDGQTSIIRCSRMQCNATPFLMHAGIRDTADCRIAAG